MVNPSEFAAVTGSASRFVLFIAAAYSRRSKPASSSSPSGPPSSVVELPTVALTLAALEAATLAPAAPLTPTRADAAARPTLLGAERDEEPERMLATRSFMCCIAALAPARASPARQRFSGREENDEDEEGGG